MEDRGGQIEVEELLIHFREATRHNLYEWTANDNIRSHQRALAAMWMLVRANVLKISEAEELGWRVVSFR